MNVNLHIDRLILDGLSIAFPQGPIVKAAVEAELNRLLSKGGIRTDLRSGGAFPSMPQNSFTSVPESNPSVLGRQIAAAVYNRIGGSK